MSTDAVLAERIEAYVRAKDGNRPHRLIDVFAETALLEMVVNSDAIAFPALTQDCDAIADVLVSRFGQQYENVYTFCLSDPPSPGAVRFECAWLVVMTEKITGSVRAGRGLYEWSLAPPLAQWVGRLRILIDRMDVLPKEVAERSFRWIEGLPYPWCPLAALASAPSSPPELRFVIERAGILAARRGSPAS